MGVGVGVGCAVALSDALGDAAGVGVGVGVGVGFGVGVTSAQADSGILATAVACGFTASGGIESSPTTTASGPLLPAEASAWKLSIGLLDGLDSLVKGVGTVVGSSSSEVATSPMIKMPARLISSIANRRWVVGRGLP